MVVTPIYNTPLQDFLGTVIVDQPYVFFDGWSFMHCTSGIIIGLLLAKYYRGTRAWLIALALLVGYEMIEPFLVGILFVSETPKDIIYDVIVGMAGFLLGWSLSRRKK